MKIQLDNGLVARDDETVAAISNEHITRLYDSNAEIEHKATIFGAIVRTEAKTVFHVELKNGFRTGILYGKEIQ